MEMWDFMFENNETGERFFIECHNFNEAKVILEMSGFEEDDLSFLGVFNTYEADILGYDTY